MTVLSCAAALCAACAGAVCAQDPDASKDKYQLLVEQLRSSATYAAAEKALIASGPDAVPALVEGAVQLPNLKNRMTGRIARIGPGAVPKLIALLGDPAMRDTAGGILFLVAWGLIDFHHIGSILRASRQESLVLIVTLLATLFVELEFAIYVGIILSLMLYLNRTSRPEVESLVPDPLTEQRKSVVKVAMPHFRGR